jgi:hypothetical protein
MGCARVRVEHLFGVAVVGRDEEHIAGFLTGLVDGAYGRICGGDGLDGSVVYACVAYL